MNSLTRRHLLQFVIVSLGSKECWANNPKIDVIEQLGELLKKTAEAITKFGDSIAHLIKLGIQGYDAVAARREYAELIEIRAHLEKHLSGWNRPLMESIEGYVRRHRQLPPAVQESGRQWLVVIGRVEATAHSAKSLLETVNNVRSDFVLQEAYQHLTSALYGRLSLLDQLRQMQAPLEEAELNALEKAGREYRKIFEATTAASEQLAIYVKTLK